MFERSAPTSPRPTAFPRSIRARSRRRLAPILVATAVAGGCDDQVIVDDLTAGIVLEPGVVEFGPVQVGVSAVREVFVRNVGDVAVSRFAVTVEDSPDFTADLDADRIPPGGVGVITVVFSPSGLGSVTADLVVSSPDLDGPSQAKLNGAGVNSTLALDPGRLDFGNVVVGTTKTLGIDLQNDGDVEVAVTFLADTNVRSCARGGSGAAYCARLRSGAIDDDGRFRLAAGQSARLEVQFSPAVAGLRADGDFRLRACDSSACDLRVSLTGTGVEAGLRCAPAALDFGQVNPGASSRREVTCENIANEPVTLIGWTTTRDSNPGFSVDASSPRVLDDGESTTIEVVFAPTVLGDAAGTLRFETDDANPSLRTVDVALTGTGGGPEIEVLPPELNFGRVSLIAPSRRSFLIVNTGFSPLSISDIEVDVDGTASFSSSNANANVLQPGESTEVLVEFAPVAEGLIESRVRITSNDDDESTLEVAVRGEGVVLPPCNFEVVPTQMNFGAVQVTRNLRRSIEIRNRGNSACLLTAVRLVGGSTRAFSLPDGDVVSEEIPGGSSKTVTVEFAPLALGTEMGQLEFSISSPSSPFNTVDLVGVGAEGALLVVPNELNFGTIGVGCSSRARQVTVYNTGVADARIDNIELAAPGNAAFRVSSRPAPLPGAPLTLPPGQSMVFEVAFTANAVAQYGSAVEIRTEISGTPNTYIVALDGEGAVDATQVDEFEQLGRPRVDILFVVDKTTSMTQEQDSLAANFESFLRFAQAQGLDYQIGVTTTNTNAATNGERGRITSAPAGTTRQSSVTGPPANRIVTPRTSPSPEAVFAANVSYQLTGGPPSEESGLAGAELALTAPAITGQNSGLLRRDAVLSLIIVSDAQDHSPQAVDFYVNFFRSIKGFRNTNLFSLSAVAAPFPPGRCNGPGGGAYSSGRYQEAVRQTGGVYVDICTGDWSRSLEELSQTAFGFKSRFFLTNQPIQSTIEVIIDGVAFPQVGSSGGVNWAYDLASNSINFAPYATPEPGSDIQVRYTVECL